MKNLIILSFISLFTISSLFAEEKQKPYESFQGCGEYLVAGTVHTSKQGFFIIINEKTQSEYTFKSPIKEEPKLAPYINRPMKGKMLVTKMINGTIGEFKSVSELDLRIPNPLNPIYNTGFRLLKKMDCQK